MRDYEVKNSISGIRVARELNTLVRLYGKSACIVSDNETELTSPAILKWASDNRVDEWHYIDPGKSQQSASTELFKRIAARQALE